MNPYNKKLLLTIILLGLSLRANAEIIDVTLNATAGGDFFINSSEGFEPSPSFEAPQITEQFGSKADGSAGAFDSFSDIDGDEILFKNGNSAFGLQGISFSRTVVDITFRNSSESALVPTLQSQILPAGMGIYMSDCSAENVRECAVSNASGVTFDDIGLSAYNGTSSFVKSSFNFKVLINGVADPLFELSGNLGLQVDVTSSTIEVVQELSSASNVLNNFRQTSALDSRREISFDWGATDFEVIFPNELLPDEVVTLSYIIETSTETLSDCGTDCPVAYAAFGDPIGRGGAAGTRLSTTMPTLARSAFSTRFATSNHIPINGYEAGLYRMALPTFEDGILTYKANSGPGLDTASVSAPAAGALLVIGMGFIGLSRKRLFK